MKIAGLRFRTPFTSGSGDPGSAVVILGEGEPRQGREELWVNLAADEKEGSRRLGMPL